MRPGSHPRRIVNRYLAGYLIYAALALGGALILAVGVLHGTAFVPDALFGQVP
jgi:hypothetical protein